VKEDVKYSKINRNIFELIEAAGCERHSITASSSSIKTNRLSARY
jgi:hypothetical protein